MRTDCPFCHHEDAVLHRQGQRRMFDGTGDLYRCRECDVVYPRPRLEGHEIRPLLPKVYPDVKHLAFSSKNPSLETICRCVPRGSKVLDVGAFTGAFCEELGRHGYAASGIEALESAAEFARSKGLDVRNGSFPEDLDIAAEAGRYDLVTANEVVYYFVDLKAALEAFRELLRPGGWLCIKTCQADAKYYNDHGNSYFKIFGDYLQGFPTRRSLVHSLESVGLHVVSMEGLATPYRFARQHAGRPVLGRLSLAVESVLNRWASRLRPMASMDRYVVMAQRP